MFKAKTVFVVGAGASCEAGLPSGHDLKAKIAHLLDIRFEHWTQLSGDPYITNAFRELVKSAEGAQGDFNPYLKKCWRIRDVLPTTAISIDNFLDAHRGDDKMEICGKLGIIKSILDAEANSKMRPGSDQGREFKLSKLENTWYLSFLQMLTEGVAKDEIGALFDNISIICFNYDRCIERFLPQGLADYYEIDLDEAQEIVSGLKIYHPYGTVGPLPWANGAGIPFGSYARNDLLALARQIKTFNEGLDDQELIAGIRNAVSDAATIIFLGFAFHPQNIEMLVPEPIGTSPRIFATGRGISDSDQSAIKRDLDRLLISRGQQALNVPDANIEILSAQCVDFFQHYWRSLTAAPR